MSSKIPPQDLPTFTPRPESLIRDAERLIEKSIQVADRLCKNTVPATFQDVIIPLVMVEQEIEQVKSMLSFYEEFSADKRIRKASRKARELFDAFFKPEDLEKDLRVVIDAVVKRAESLDPESQKLLKYFHTDFLRSDHLLSEEKKLRPWEIHRRLLVLKSEFDKDLNSTRPDQGIWFTVSELDGVPSNILDNLQKHDWDEDLNMLFVDFNSPYSDEIGKYPKSSETRKRIFLGRENYFKENVPILKEIFVLRDEYARLFGHANHAALCMERRALRSTSSVNEFLEELRSRFLKNIEREKASLMKIKRDHSDEKENDGRLYLWDLCFCNRILKEELSFDPFKVAEYFELDATVDGMIGMFAHLFGLAFVQDEGASPERYWHKDVKLFHVWDSDSRGGQFVGYLYMDLYKRRGKGSNPRTTTPQPGFLDADGNRKFPVTVLMLGLSKPKAPNPCLLKHHELISLFHEFGHCIHNLVSRTKYAQFHGAMVCMDLCEIPSLMLENWCWSRCILESLGRHYSSLSATYRQIWKNQSGEDVPPPPRMPSEMISSIIRTRSLNPALSKSHTLHCSLFDIAVHSPESHQDIVDMDISQIYNRLCLDVTGLDSPQDLGLEWGQGAGAMQILTQEYDVAYYAYLLGEVYALDMFYTHFKENPMDATQGLRYREMVLEKGGSEDGLGVLLKYLGRKPTPTAFFKEFDMI